MCVSKILLLLARREVLFCPRGRALARVRAVFLMKLFSNSSIDRKQILQKKGRKTQERVTLSLYLCRRVRRKNSAAARVQKQRDAFYLFSSFLIFSLSLSLSLMVTRAGREKQQIIIIP